jgi:biotin carboxylase
MKKLMILGASILQLPAIHKAKEMGLQVIAVDMNKNAIGFRNADICLEISTLDIPKVVKAAKQHDIDGIMTLASDMPMRTVAAVANKLGIAGISQETALKATNKAIMRDCLYEHNVPIPKYFRVDSYQEYINSIQQFRDKFIVKPADNSGSRGVFLINDSYDKEIIQYAFNYSKKNSRSGEIVVEDYMEGAEVSVETLSVDGKVHIIAITDKLTTGAPRFVEMGHSQPSCLPEEIKNDIALVTTKAVKAIGITNGPAHTEIIVTNEGPKVVELGARLGGDNITTHLVPISTGVDMVKCCIDIALGEKPDLMKKVTMGSAIRYFESTKGKILNISGYDKALQLEGVNQISFVKHIGDYVGDISSSSDRIGFVISQANDAHKAVSICNKVKDLIQIRMES